MYHFFTETEFFTGTEAVITGPDVNHIKNVLRMKPGEKILLSDGKGTNCLCEITELFPDKVLAKILPEEVDDTELPVQVTLYQGLPKADKMEFIIQKCVELGVTKIVPVDTDRAVVKLDAKKEEAKRKRWYGISESAAKQSKRMIVPEIGNVMKFKAAIEAAKMDLVLADVCDCFVVSFCFLVPAKCFSPFYFTGQVPQSIVYKKNFQNATVRSHKSNIFSVPDFLPVGNNVFFHHPV